MKDSTPLLGDTSKSTLIPYDPPVDKAADIPAATPIQSALLFLLKYVQDHGDGIKSPLADQHIAALAESGYIVLPPKPAVEQNVLPQPDPLQPVIPSLPITEHGVPQSPASGVVNVDATS